VFWDVETGRESHRGDTRFPDGGTIAFSPDGETVATGGWSDEGRVRLWSTATGRLGPVVSRVLPNVRRLSFSPDGHRIALACDQDHTVHLLDRTTLREVIPENGPSSGIYAAARAPVGDLACTFHSGALHVWDARTGAAVGQPIGVPEHQASYATFAPDGTGALVEFRTFRDNHFRWIDPWTRTFGKQLDCRSLPYIAVAVSVDGAFYAEGHANGLVTIGDRESGEQQGQLGRKEELGQLVYKLDFSPDRRLLAVECCQDRVQVWDVRAEKVLSSLRWSGATRHLLFSPDSRTLAIVAEREVVLVETASGQIRGVLRSQAVHATRVAFAPSGRMLIAGGEDGSIWSWDLFTGRQSEPRRAHDGPVTALAFWRDGKVLMTGSADTTALVWDTTRLPVPFDR
jgi:WD40 repeat protein